MQARTIPVCFGVGRAVLIAGASLAGAMVLTVAVFLISPLTYGAVFALLSLTAACYLLIDPVMRLVRNKDRDAAMGLFNRASYYPLSMLAVTILDMMI